MPLSHVADLQNTAPPLGSRPSDHRWSAGQRGFLGRPGFFGGPDLPGVHRLPGRHDLPELHNLPGRRWRAAATVLLGTFLLVNASTPTLPVTLNRITAIAYAIEAGQNQPGWRDGGIPYSWGGGHDEAPGPSQGYQGSIQPCPATTTRGLDCSGLVRWVYHLAYGRDVLGPGNTDDHVKRLRKIPAGEARPGDLVFYGEVGTRKVRTHHVGVYVGQGKMINALRTGTEVRIDRVTALGDLAGYFRYT
ncbi:C40 family peptidase [Streptosporangium amethystogenes]|uniref:C40 family peptidase n=1 Tax=Streptosporangium amethystogenes TaxID=2002 RepID=UPI0037ABF30F